MDVLSNPILGRQSIYEGRGFNIVYHDGEPNRCPGCGRQHWLVGRVTAECAFCKTALPLENVNGFGFSPRFVTSHMTATLPSELRPMT